MRMLSRTTRWVGQIDRTPVETGTFLSLDGGVRGVTQSAAWCAQLLKTYFEVLNTHLTHFIRPWKL